MRMKTPKKNGGGGNLISSNNNRSENIDTYAGLLKPPLPLSRAMSFSYSHPLSASNSLFNHHHHHSYVQQPPLLPLPHNNKKSKRDEPKKKRSGTQSILVVASDPKLLLGMGNIHDVVSESVFNLAPPPSSLPLPKFSLRSKPETAAGGVDDGATNNLRRLLRLR